MTLTGFERKKYFDRRFAEILMEDMHLCIYFKIQEQLMDRDSKICEFQIRKKKKLKSNNNKTRLHHKNRLSSSVR